MAQKSEIDGVLLNATRDSWTTGVVVAVAPAK